MADKTLQTIRDVGLIPVIRANSADEAHGIVDAVKAAGVNVIEITMTVPGAIEIMREVAAASDDVLLGAGTVLDPETARLAILAGAKFIVTPTLNVDVIRMVKRYGLVVCPGALTPTEVITAWEAGADVVKVFPCDAMGGASYIKALKGPLPQVRLIPTGGVDLDTAASFLEAGAEALGVGSAMLPKDAIANKDWDRIAGLAQQFMEIVGKARQ
jgi:2-dehydro-3-deoxyphosphogluconate aldolase/(4S)-4-hydroxy-2-oxoglutarate aldolase